ncbi:MAG: UDP-N-acetylmuramoyl-L-alanyl-D-glutamate--2,6-diaminopimelate ligase [Candidatus Omnitrophica bacterium]|nr:UDP-N-acetylmuramoyl-L-alanyl-D-glutamate--2,6-diaminopimelate ligase [Candidatus Omnitrophota bacterium]
MSSVPLSKILKGLNIIRWMGPDVELRSISDHSQQVRPGGLFIALQGTAQTGSYFAAEAVSRGASAVVFVDPEICGDTDALSPATRVWVDGGRQAVSRMAAAFYGYPGERLKVLGVTGTNGKTTISFLLRYLLERAGHSTGLIGTVRYCVGRRSIPSKQTTPGPVTLQRLLSDMEKEGQRWVVLEASSHALDQGRVAHIGFEAGIFSNLTQDHLDYHKNFETYYRAKRRLFELLVQGGLAVINVDDPYGARLGQSLRRTRPDLRIVRVSVQGGEADCGVRGASFDASGTQGEFFWSRGCEPIRTQLVGEFNLSNLALSVAALIHSGVHAKELFQALPDFAGAPGRLERISTGQGVEIYVDYAHTPDALERVLETLRPLCRESLRVVFGCGGDRDRKKRPVMGEIADRLADAVYVTSDNPRSEDPGTIMEEILQGTRGRSRCVGIPDRYQAIRRAYAESKPGDWIVVAGKGHEAFQLMGNVTHSFDDRQVLRAIIREFETRTGVKGTAAVTADPDVERVKA